LELPVSHYAEIVCMSTVNSNPYEGPTPTASPSSQVVSYKPIWSSVVLAVLLFLIAAPRGSIFTALGLGLFIAPVQGIILLFTVVRRRHRENAVRMRLLRIGVYTVTLVAMFVHASLEQRAARARAEEIVKACHAYETDHGQLPEDLSQIVPAYFPSLPATLGLIAGKPYFYLPPKDGSPASFVYLPELFTSRRYNFATREWSSYAS